MEYVRDNLEWIVPLAVGIFVFAAAVWLLVLWLSSRGRFMFLHNVVTNRAEVAIPWNEYRVHGNSLFFFRLALSVAGFVVVVPLVVVLISAIVQMVMREEANAGGIALAGLAVLGTIVVGVFFALIGKFTKDFVVPIMRVRTPDCLAAWREFLGLLTANPAHFTVYILFHVLLTIIIGILTVAAVVVTCCIAGCLLAIPYVGTVLFLPVLVFLRAFSLYYLAQYGPHYDVFTPVAATALAAPAPAMAPPTEPPPAPPTTPPDAAPGPA